MVEGFIINRDGTHEKTLYDSEREHCWTEITGYHEAGLHEEAHQKLGEFHYAIGGSFLKNDWAFILNIQLSYLKVKPTEKNLEDSRHAWSKAMFDHDFYFDLQEMAGIAQFLVDTYIKLHSFPVHFDDYCEATPEQTVKTLEFMLTVLKLAINEDYFTWFKCNGFLQRFSMGIFRLCLSDDNKKAQELIKEVQKLPYYGNYFTEEDNPMKSDDEMAMDELDLKDEIDFDKIFQL